MQVPLREVKLVTNEKDIVEEVVTEVENEQVEGATADTNSEEQLHSESVEVDELTLALNKVKELEDALDENENKLLRLQADFDNYRRRVRLDQEAAEKYRAQSLVSDILPSLDNFERALKVETNDEQMKSLLQGMEMVYKGLIEAVKKEGVEIIESVGQQFDPHLHQAVMQVDEPNVESNVIVEEFQKGYKLKDRVIRPSMVKVNQ
ncbi:nucleotide exchange factor GrpE [Bacillus suaedaesalsae]|uniref:Protein GrpE n=1 Tax=Bacillus suaedaesalsae TaxID=2810349 RepID=A0ABS2DLI0_9BACI|nr:nucleotide exchange factor GrpE [Bacillus suaedaesalsae]MBM6619242.1 nucleotide exchange factor GrpE [Bacillus suaedaesalsae]